MLAKIAKLVQLQELGFMEDITTVRWTYEATNATREAHRVDRPPRFTRLLYAPPRRCGYSPIDCKEKIQVLYHPRMVATSPSKQKPLLHGYLLGDTS